MRGRKPTPTRLKLIRGNPGRRPINRDEPAADSRTSLASPDWFNPEQRKKWEEVTAQLSDAGMLSAAYADIITVYCVAWTRWRSALDQITKFGDLIKTPSGVVRISPYLAIANRAQVDLLKAQAELGLTPSSRSRVKANAPGRSSRLESFLGTKTQRQPEPF